MKSDYAYYRRRASNERHAAGKSAHPMATRAHLELAARSEELATQIAAQITSDEVSSGEGKRESTAAIERLVGEISARG